MSTQVSVIELSAYAKIMREKNQDTAASYLEQAANKISELEAEIILLKEMIAFEKLAVESLNDRRFDD